MSLVTLIIAQSMFGFAQDKRIGSEILAKSASSARDSVIPSTPLRDSASSLRQARTARRSRVSQSDSSATTVAKPTTMQVIMVSIQVYHIMYMMRVIILTIVQQTK